MLNLIDIINVYDKENKNLKKYLNHNMETCKQQVNTIDMKGKTIVSNHKFYFILQIFIFIILLILICIIVYLNC